jgi:hypothetical protein
MEPIAGVPASNEPGLWIDLSEPLDVEFWTTALEIDEVSLRSAVSAVGTSNKKVRQYVTGYPSPFLR